MPFCKESIKIFHFNVLRRIKKLYHSYIEIYGCKLTFIDFNIYYYTYYFLKDMGK